MLERLTDSPDDVLGVDAGDATGAGLVVSGIHGLGVDDAGGRLGGAALDVIGLDVLRAALVGAPGEARASGSAAPAAAGRAAHARCIVPGETVGARLGCGGGGVFRLAAGGRSTGEEIN